MKARIDYKSKKTITIVVIALVILIAAIVGTIAFMNGNESSKAALTDKENAGGTSVNSNNGNSEKINNNEQGSLVDENSNSQDEQNTDNDNEDNSQMITENGNNITNNNSSTNSTTNDNDTIDNNITNAGNTTANRVTDANNAGTITSVIENTDNNKSGGMTTSQTTNTDVPNQEYTQTTVIPGGGDLVLVSENENIGWSPLSLNALTTIANLGINKPQLESEKIAYVQGDILSESPQNTAIQKDEIITYVIKVSNKGNIDAKNIRINDFIPEGTELVQDSITNDGRIENKKISWKKDIKANETIEVSFKVKVIKNEITLIENVAKVNGKNTNKIETPVITSLKTAKLVKDKDVIIDLDNEDTVKVGAKIRFTITVNNKSNIEALTKISDTVPEGTDLVEESVTNNGSVLKSEVDGKTVTNIEWKNIKINANEKFEASFDVIVNKDARTSIINTAKVGDTNTTTTENKIYNITTTKSSIPSNDTLHELDTITYTLAVSNNGSGEGSVKICDEVPEGTTLQGSVTVTGDSKKYTENELNKGIDVKVKPGESKNVTFTVKINAFEGEEKVIKNLVAKQDDEIITPGTEDTVKKEYTTISGEKTWVLPEGREHSTVTVKLYRNETNPKTNVIEKTLVSETTTEVRDGKEIYSFDKLDKYDITDNHEYIYEVKEDLSEDSEYIATYEGFNIINTIKQDNTVEISGNKTWVDSANSVHPTVTVRLLKNGEKIDTTTVQNGKYKFTGLEKYKTDKDGKYILNDNGKVQLNEYTIEEVQDEDSKYTATYEKTEKGYDIKNTIKQDNTVEISGKKTWVDVKDSVHSEVTVKLLKNGQEKETITTQNGEYKFTGLEKYKTNEDGNYVLDNNGNVELNEYTVQEIQDEDSKYTVAYEKTEKGYDIKNTIKQENTVKISGKKTWINPEETVTSEVTVNLLKNGTKVDTKTTTNLSYEFTDLEKYMTDENGEYILDKNGNVQLNKYTVEEVQDENSNYIVTYTETENGYDITNTIDYDTLKTSITAKKIWDDNNDEAGVRNTTSVSIRLYKNGTKTDIKKEAKASNNWTVLFDGLPKYTKEGSLIEYTVDEVDVPNGYVKTVSGNEITNALPRMEIKKSVYSLNELVLPEQVEENNVTVVVDDIVGYKIKVTNTGNIPLTNVKVTDKMKNGNAIFLDYNNPSETISATTQGVATIAENVTLGVGESKEYIVYYKVKATDVTTVENSIENTVKATGEYKDSNGNNKKVEDDDYETVAIKDLPGITIKKSQSVNGKELSKNETNVKVEQGTVIDYTITVTNTGNTIQEDVKVTDIMNQNPSGDARKVKITGIKVNGETRNYIVDDTGALNIGNLKVGETAIITATYTVEEKDMADTTQKIENKVSVTTKTNTTDPEDPSKPIEDKVEVPTEEWKSDISVSKTGTLSDGSKITENTEKTVEYGKIIKYEIKASNEGNKDGKVTIKDLIQKDDVELKGDIVVKIGDSKTTTITQEKLENGYEITVPGNTTATITFTVTVKAYSGTVISNKASYDTEKEKNKETEEVKIMTEDSLTMISTVSKTTPVTVPQKAILVLDFSGSMDDEINGVKRITSLKKAVNTFLTKFLNGTNEVMIIRYSDNAKVICEYTKDKKTAYSSIENKEANGGTNIDAGLTLANSKITSDATNTSVILMTDGIPGYYIDDETGKSVEVPERGWYYNERAGKETVNAAARIKAKGSKVYSIGFGLNDRNGKLMLQSVASPTTYNVDGTVKNNYYYATFDGNALEEAFKNIVNSITTTTDSEPIILDTKDGIVTISEGFKENQKIEVYTGTYNSESKPIETISWNDFISSKYVEYSSNEIKFKLGEYMKDKKLEANTQITLRFVD